MNIFGRSDIGKVRDTNQDTFAFGQLTDETGYLLVCDGMGGENGGNVASQMARDVICNQIIKNLHKGMESNSIRNLIETSLSAANSTVFSKAKADASLHNMGTTAVLAIISNNSVHVGHVGDSRAYLIHDGKLKLLTRDHSWVQMLLETGEIKQEDIKNHPKKNQLTRAIGVETKIIIDYNEYEILNDDRLMLCTDGLTNSCADSEMTDIINNSSSSEQAVTALIQAANDDGGYDNITVAMAEYN